MSSIAHTARCHILSVHAVIVPCTCADAVFLSTFCIDECEAPACCDSLQKDFVEHCFVPSEISSTLSGALDRGTLVSLPKLISPLALCVGICCVRFRMHYRQFLYGLLCIFTSTVKYYSTINAWTSSDISICTAVADIETAYSLWLN
jgi:hypothetical protein